MPVRELQFRLNSAWISGLFFSCVYASQFLSLCLCMITIVETKTLKWNMWKSIWSIHNTESPALSLSLSLRVPICRADDRKLFRIRSDLNAINSPFSLTTKNIHKQYFAGNKLIKRSANKQTTKCGFCLDYVFGTATPACALCTEEIEFRRGQIFWEMIYWITHFVCVCAHSFRTFYQNNKPAFFV